MDGLDRAGKEGVPEPRKGPSYESKAPKPVPSAKDALAWLADAMEAKGHPEAGKVREAAETIQAPAEAKTEGRNLHSAPEAPATRGAESNQNGF